MSKYGSGWREKAKDLFFEWGGPVGFVAALGSTLYLVESNLETGKRPGDHIVGRVINESGSLAKLVGLGSKYSDEVKISEKETYLLIVDTEDGLYTIDVDVDDRSGSSGPHTAANLAAIIEKGSKIKFARKYSGESLFSNDKLGIVDPDDIEILGE